MPLARSIVPCETSQVTPCDCRSFVNVAENWNLELVGTVAVTGDKPTEMPESTIRTLVSVFFVSAAEVAVIVTSRMQVCVVPLQLVPVIVFGSGIVCGAVKMTVVLVDLSGMVPEAALQVCAVPVVCLPVLSKVEVA